MATAPKDPLSQSTQKRTSFSIPRAIIVVVLSFGLCQMVLDILVVKWKVQRQAPPDAWPFTLFRYACAIQIAATVLLATGSPPLARLFRVSQGSQGTFQLVYRLAVGILVIVWFAMAQAIAGG